MINKWLRSNKYNNIFQRVTFIITIQTIWCNQQLTKVDATFKLLVSRGLKTNQDLYFTDPDIMSFEKLKFYISSGASRLEAMLK